MNYLQKEQHEKETTNTIAASTLLYYKNIQSQQVEINNLKSQLQSVINENQEKVNFVSQYY